MRLLTIIIVIFIIIILFYKITNKNMVFCKSNIDNKYYMVRDLSDKQIACNMLALNRNKMITLIRYLNDNKTNKYKDYENNINRLYSKINDLTISENNGNGKETSYSVNKGDELVICLRSKSEWNKFWT